MKHEGFRELNRATLTKPAPKSVCESVAEFEARGGVVERYPPYQDSPGIAKRRPSVPGRRTVGV